MKTAQLLLLLVVVIGFSMPAAYASTSSTSVHLKITTYSNSSLTSLTSRVHEGGSLYVVVSLRDASGNPVIWSSSTPLLITLYARVGVLSATSVFITAGNSNTSSSFGLILYLAPSTPGHVRILASATISEVSQTTSKRILVLAPPTAILTH